MVSQIHVYPTVANSCITASLPLKINLNFSITNGLDSSEFNALKRDDFNNFALWMEMFLDLFLMLCTYICSFHSLLVFLEYVLFVVTSIMCNSAVKMCQCDCLVTKTRLAIS